MLKWFTCTKCGEKFLHEENRHGGNQSRYCEPCRKERLRELNRGYCAKYRADEKRKRAEARKAARLVRRCRRCGEEFVQDKRPSLVKISASSDAYVLRSYCPSCTWKMKRAARACDPRDSGVGGHGDILDYGTIVR